jgi:hypothetical protein
MATEKPVPTRRRPPSPRSTPAPPQRLLIAGFKSIREEQAVELRPLTLLAGQNSSGKSCSRA